MTALQRRRLHVLLTSVGGLGVPYLIDALRQRPEFDLTITGVDANPDGIGSYFVDHFVCVPPANDPQYAETVLDICLKRGVEIVIPQSDGEALSLSEAESRFVAVGCTILGSPYDATRIAVNKHQWLPHLRDCGVPVPRFHLPRSVEEVDAALADLGFPDSPVVFKPVASAGGRGFRLISAEFDELGHILTTKKETLLSPRRLRALLQDAKTLPEFLLMEYLAGDSFSVDVLLGERRAEHVITQRRLTPSHGPVEVAQLERNAHIDEAIQRIVSAFSFRYVINIDMAYRGAQREGGLFPLDINPRPSATIASTQAAGCFLLAEAMLDALGIERPSKRCRGINVVRYWSEKSVPMAAADEGCV